MQLLKNGGQKRILHLVESDGLYGAENVILNLSRMMMEDGKFIPLVACILGGKDKKNPFFDELLPYNIEVASVLVRKRFFALEAARACKVPKNLGVDLIHSHGYKPSIIAFMAKSLWGIPVLATCHLRFNGRRNSLPYRIMMACETYLYRHFENTIAVSPAIGKYLINKGAYPSKVNIIENGIPVKDYEERDNGNMKILRQKLGIDQTTAVVLNIGRLCEQKNHEAIIRAAGLLKQKNLKMMVLIAGDGGFLPSIA